MKGRSTLVGLCALLTLGAPLAVRASDDPARPLRFNPFAQPDLGAIEQAGAPRAPSGAVGGWAPVLTATLVAGEESLANLGGVVLEVGEETHGYRLVAVDEFEASFEKNGATLVLPVESQGRAQSRGLGR